MIFYMGYFGYRVWVIFYIRVLKMDEGDVTKLYFRGLVGGKGSQ